jgi:hypothetical protein
MPWPPRWSYVQARLQARHGERLDEAAWRLLEGARSAEQFLERARGSFLERFVARLESRMSSHMVERILRAEWRDYVREVANWAPKEWRPAVRWAGAAAALPLLAGATNPDRSAWLAEDAGTYSVAQVIGGDGPVAERWLARWLRLWPKARIAECKELKRLIDIFEEQFADLEKADMQDSSRRHREKLAGGLIRLFRRHPATPLALFCHLALEWLELERLRGGMVRRILFQAGDGRRAA